MRRQLAKFGLSEEIVRYGFVALTALLVDIILIAFFKGFGWPLPVILFVAYGGGTLWNYFWSKHWVYAYQRLNGTAKEPVLFLCLSLASFFATLISIHYLILFGFSLFTAKLLAEIVVGVAGFTSKKLLLFTNFQSLTSTYHMYEEASLGSLLHILYRRMSLPLKTLLSYIPPEAKTIAEIGTGHGLIINSLAALPRTVPLQALYGCDIDRTKLTIAKQAATSTGLKVDFDTKLPTNRWDVIMIVDVLYLLQPAQQRKLITNATKLLSPGGCLLIKEMARTPWWKFAIVRLQERLSVFVLGITKVEHNAGNLVFVDLDQLAASLKAQHFHSQLHRLDRGWIYPHYLLKAMKAQGKK